MNIERMQKGIALLIANANNPTGMKFDLHDWGRSYYFDEDGSYVNGPPVGINCGTTGCAMGLFALSGEFEADGLMKPQINATAIRVSYSNPANHDDCGGGFNAAAKLFGITYDEVIYLFDPSSYGGNTVGAEAELEVARRMQVMVDNEIAGISTDT